MKDIHYDEITCVKCLSCGTMHDISSKDFICFYGNVTIGTDGGIIGNNLDEDMKVTRCKYICSNPSCLLAVFKDSFKYSITSVCEAKEILNNM